MISRLTWRMIAPTMVASALLLLIGGVAGWYVDRLQRDSSDLLAVALTKMQVAEELEIVTYKGLDRLNAFCLSGDQTHLDELRALGREADRGIGEAERMAASLREITLIAKIKQGHKELFAAMDTFTVAPAEGSSRQWVPELVHGKGTRDTVQALHEFRKLNRESVTRATRREQVTADRVSLGLLLLGVSGAVAGLLAGYGITRGISQSISKLSVPIRDATGKLSGVVGPITLSSGQNLQEMEGALQAMSDRIGAVVEKLQESQRRATRAEQLAAMGQLAAGLAHELRNPLTSMKILVQSAAEEGESAALRGRHLAVLEEEISRLDRSIQTFLDYARPPRPERRMFLLGDVLKQTVELVSRRAAQLGVQIDCQLSQDVVEVEADPGQIRQVLLNMLLNALEASRDGGKVLVRTNLELAADARGCQTDVNSAARWITIEIADTGSGLSPDVGDRIFEPFISTKDGGTGLGLAICKRIVEDHGGRIVATNRAEGGAVFKVRLPADQATTDSLGSQPSRPAGASEE